MYVIRLRKLPFEYRFVNVNSKINFDIIKIGKSGLDWKRWQIHGFVDDFGGNGKCGGICSILCHVNRDTATHTHTHPPTHTQTHKLWMQFHWKKRCILRHNIFEIQIQRKRFRKLTGLPSDFQPGNANHVSVFCCALIETVVLGWRRHPKWKSQQFRMQIKLEY